MSALNPALLAAEPTGMDAGNSIPADKVERARALLMEAASRVDWLWWQHEHGVNVYQDEVTDAQSAKSVAERAVKAARNPGAGNPMLIEGQVLEAMKAKLVTLHVNQLPRHMEPPLLALPKSLKPKAVASWRNVKPRAAAPPPDQEAKAREEADRSLAEALHEAERRERVPRKTRGRSTRSASPSSPPTMVLRES